ncbi:MAG: LacI family DNA-binding transcriptional regulator, partial [Rectinemataceae bacterium]|nr:LacI family DNA-binding transcriptional regulator [Rectinemataceae bacterium]
MKKPNVTIRDVAALAEVSTATVSRVLNDDPKVSEEARRRVRGAVESLSYRINQVARSLKTNSTRTIGVIAPALDSVFFMLLAENLERELSKSGYSIFVCSSLESADEEKKRVKLMLERLVDALVIIPATDGGRHLASFIGKGTPILFIDRSVRDIEADAVIADNERGAFEATRALISDGFDRIGFIGGSLDVSTARERYVGYKRAMDEAGLAV